jgi:hypothetical protein
MSIPISQLSNGGLPNGDVEFPATNPLNTTQSVNGTTFKYYLVDVLQYILNAQGFTTYTNCRVATVALLNATYSNGTAGVGATLTNAGAQAVLAIDGITLVAGDRVLVKNQTSTFQNGIYVVSNIGSASTNWVLTRADDYNQSSEIVYLGVVAITQGLINAGLVFQENSQGPFVIGTSPITFQQLQIDITLLPSASPANKILRSDGTYWVQSTNASLDSTDKLYNLSELQVDNININGNTISSTDIGGNIVITPNTVGSIVLDGLSWPQVDGTNGQAITTNGAGQLGWTSFGAPYTPAALTSVSDSNVTITLGGTPLTALLQATSITMGWSGLLPISRGGTNTSTLGSSGQLAQSDGTKYSWTTATYPATATTTGTILRADGTNWVATTATYPATTTINQILYSSANNVIGEITTANNGVLITSAGGVPSISSTLPTAVQGNITSVGTIGSGTWQGNTIAVGYGGTGATTIGANGTLAQSNGTIYTFTTATYPSTTTANQLLYSSATNTVGGLASANSATLITSASGVPSWQALTDGQVLIGVTAGSPTAAQITGSGGITVSSAAGTINISGTGSGIGWTEVTGTTQSMSADAGYVASNAGLVTMTLPNLAAFGTVINVQGKGAGGWKIAQNAGQTIHFGNVDTTTGATGYLASTNRYDSIQLLCITANTDWAIMTTQGVVTYN